MCSSDLDVHPRDMRPRIDEIIEFTELGYFIDMPVRTYSAGMMIRLCFAVATSVRPQILLMDEWVGAPPEQILKGWRELSATLGRRVRIDVGNKSTEGLAEDLGPKGELIVDGFAFVAGSVTHL